MRAAREKKYVDYVTKIGSTPNGRIPFGRLPQWQNSKRQNCYMADLRQNIPKGRWMKG
jgi:hypothetical protein